VDRDTGDVKLAKLYAQIWAFNWIIKRCIEEQQKLIEHHPYITLNDSECELFCSRPGSDFFWDEPVITANSRPAMLKRLLDYRFDTLQKPLDQVEAERDVLITELEVRAGRLVNVEETMAKEEQQRKYQWTKLLVPLVPDPQIQPATITRVASDATRSGSVAHYTKYEKYSQAELIEQAKIDHLPHEGSRDELIYQLAKA
jgi:hypothetical protein